MSEKAMVCKALGAMFREHGEPNEAEVTFVGNAAMELGLDQQESAEVMEVLKQGGDYRSFVEGIESRLLKTFFFRRVVAAVLMDEKIEDHELKLIDDTAKMMKFDAGAVQDYLAWMKEGIEWEKRGVGIMNRL